MFHSLRGGLKKTPPGGEAEAGASPRARQERRLRRRPVDGPVGRRKERHRRHDAVEGQWTHYDPSVLIIFSSWVETTQRRFSSYPDTSCLGLPWCPRNGQGWFHVVHVGQWRHTTWIRSWFQVYGLSLWWPATSCLDALGCSKPFGCQQRYAKPFWIGSNANITSRTAVLPQLNSFECLCISDWAVGRSTFCSLWSLATHSNT